MNVPSMVAPRQIIQYVLVGNKTTLDAFPLGRGLVYVGEKETERDFRFFCKN